MANVFPNRTRELFATAGVDWTDDTIKIVLTDAAYTYNSAHDFLDDVGSGGRVAISGALASKTVTDGWLDCADVLFAGIAAAETITGLWVFKDTTVEATSPLLMWFDTDGSSTAISVTTTGSDVTVIVPASGFARI
jgi:hypothetical protein